MLGDNEMIDDIGTDLEEIPCDGDVVMPGIVTSNIGILSVNLGPRHCNRASQ